MVNDDTTGQVGGLVRKFEAMVTYGDILKQKSEVRMTKMRFETTNKSPGKRRRMCGEEQARPRAGLHRPGSRASPASMSRRTRPPRPSVPHWTGMPPSLLELGRQATRTPSPPSPGSTGSRQGTWA